MHPKKKKKVATSRRGSKIWDLSDARQLLTDRFIRGRSSVPLISAGRSCGKMGPLGGAAVLLATSAGAYCCYILLL